jgi:HAD superfamily hydrolase (TIGR01509 family)
MLQFPIAYANDTYVIYKTQTTTNNMQNQAESTTGLRAVTFDLDGLMFNTEQLYQEVDREILARRGKDFPALLCDRMMGRKASEALQIMIDWHQLEETTEQLADEIAALFAQVLPRRLAPMPGLLPLLEALERASIPKAIATSSGRKFVDQVLGQFSLKPRFEFVLTGEDIQHGKPEPDVYLLAADRLGIPCKQMMVLEDSQIGCQAATTAGAYTVAVPHGRSLEHKFPKVQCTATSLADPRIAAALQMPQPDLPTV